MMAVLLMCVSCEVKGWFFRLCCLETEPGYSWSYFYSFFSEALFMVSWNISPHLTLFARNQLIHKLLTCSGLCRHNSCKVHLPVPSF